MTKEKLKGYLYCFLSYVIAFLVAVIVGVIFRFLHPLIMILLADLAATLVIFVISSILKNTSFYDPYWSVAPLIIMLYYLNFPSTSNYGNIRSIIVSILIFIWSNRLTFNWLRQWKGLRHEDWRYVNYRQKLGRNFWVINLIGLQLMPTILVYLGSISLYPTLSLGGELFGVLDILATVVTIIAILFEAIADQQLYKFVQNRESPQEIITKGLWAYSRHPNYFGEILFWWGLFLFGLSADKSFYWATIGPICITILFNAVSIPLMEKRNLLRKPDYFNYKKRVSRLIPWFPKKKQ
jgi:steroid 5-alpha reductase family enzyme